MMTILMIHASFKSSFKFCNCIHQYLFIIDFDYIQERIKLHQRNIYSCIYFNISIICIISLDKNY